MSAAATGRYLSDGGYDAPAPRYGVDQYRLVYRTVDADGRATTASGLVVLPDSGARTLHTVAYEHGTLVAKSDAPSVDESDARVSPTLFAGRGYAAVAPDYLGLGEGPGVHPYMDTATETTASVDMLRAARAFAAGRGRTLDGRVLVTGFSQGGTAATALARALQSGVDPHFEPAALAPVSGPYDVQHAEIPAAFGDDPTLDPKEAAFYFAYWTVAMNRLHHFYDAPSQVFAPPTTPPWRRCSTGCTASSRSSPACPRHPSRCSPRSSSAGSDTPPGPCWRPCGSTTPPARAGPRGPPSTSTRRAATRTSRSPTPATAKRSSPPPAPPRRSPTWATSAISSPRCGPCR
ncbi:lipase family protein [Actinacidiphila sp. DG2A-62]|uniref:lipase family protein n=1 Tax=Actinacidiphila sp. DG2A-62 TaxID=3108821 RepID=UPI002DBFB382|nr:lipase family protein [Actinacidiphila sp. DG2A-62]MEC3995091.1 lipase family protein [Actinacidiphila sp. DG2A-62]